MITARLRLHRREPLLTKDLVNGRCMQTEMDVEGRVALHGQRASIPEQEVMLSPRRRPQILARHWAPYCA